MSEEDVNIGEETPTEETSTPEKTVPYERFKEVNEDRRTKEQELEALKAKQGEQLSPEQQKEKQAREYLRNLIKEEREAFLRAEKESQAKEQMKFEREVDDTLAIHTDVKKDDFLKFIENKGEEYGITSVKGAMKLYKDLNQIKSDTAEETKENIKKKPNLPKSEGTQGSTPVDDSGKSYQQVVDEALKELETKGQK